MGKIRISAITAITLAFMATAMPSAAQDQIHRPMLNIQYAKWDGTRSVYEGKGTATIADGTIQTIEYFLNDATHTPGTGISMGVSGFSPLQFTFSIRSSTLRTGDNTICFHARSSNNIWSDTLCMTATK